MSWTWPVRDRLGRGNVGNTDEGTAMIVEASFCYSEFRDLSPCCQRCGAAGALSPSMGSVPRIEDSARTALTMGSEGTVWRK